MLTDDQKQEVCKLYLTGQYSQTKLSHVFHIRKSSIRQVLTENRIKIIKSFENSTSFQKGHKPWSTNKYHTIETIEKCIIASTGKHPLAVTKQKLSNTMKKLCIRPPVIKGDKNQSKLPERRKQMVQNNPMHRPEVLAKFKGGRNPNWKGGRKLWIARCRHKRRELGHNFLNEPFEGSVGHHWNKDDVFYVPADLHKSVSHSLKDPESMNQINEAVWDWFIKEAIGIGY